MKICVSISPASMDDAISRLKRAGEKADLVEVRIDGLANVDFGKLLRKPRPKVIITNRRSSEGGQFSGSADEQRRVLSDAVRYGADYIDVELSWGHELIRSFLHTRTKVIASYHDFSTTPRNLEAIYKDLCSSGAHIVKMATTANDIVDNNRILKVLNRARIEKQKIIALCMGEYGQASRILGGMFGGFLTYASLSDTECTAPGQFTLDDLIRIYRIETLNKRTKIFGLIGNPVSHSKGVIFHNGIFRRKKVNAVYLNFLTGNLRGFLDSFRQILHGFSVTMPFKEEIVPFLDAVEKDATNLAVVNTVLVDKGNLIGYNTDLPAIASLLTRKTSLRGKRVTVMGTGGTARTIAYAAIAHRAKPTIVGRSPEKARALALELGCDWTGFDNLHDMKTDILINGTPVGMHPGKDPELVQRTFFRKGMVVFDAVSRPEMTQLLVLAASAGCTVITGMELFRRQAQLQSRLFLRHIA